MVYKYQYEKNVYKFLDNNVISDFIKKIAYANTAKMAYKYQCEKMLQHMLEQKLVLDFIKSLANPNVAKWVLKYPGEKKCTFYCTEKFTRAYKTLKADTKHGKNRFMNTGGTKKVPFRVPLIYSCCIKDRIAKEKTWQN